MKKSRQQQWDQNHDEVSKTLIKTFKVFCLGKAMRDLLTASEVARILRVDPSTVRRWVKQGALEGVILPHPFLVDLRQRDGVRLFPVTKDNRDTIHEVFLDVLKKDRIIL